MELRTALERVPMLGLDMVGPSIPGAVPEEKQMWANASSSGASGSQIVPQTPSHSAYAKCCPEP